MEHWFILPVATKGQITKGFFCLFFTFFWIWALPLPLL